MQMIAEFKKFLNGGITPEKAQQIINEKIQNGEINPSQLEQLKGQANQFLSMMKMFN